MAAKRLIDDIVIRTEGMHTRVWINGEEVTGIESIVFEAHPHDFPTVTIRAHIVEKPK